MHGNKERITVTIDPELLKQLDEVSEARDESRSTTLERILRNELPNERAWVKDMEKPVMRAVAHAMTSSPAFLSAVLYLTGEAASEEEVKRRIENVERQMKLGRERQMAKTGKKG